ncbi:hypothetical protein AB1Y20_001904 [Prymnesium parvum]|uniref:Phosphatidic acid phosphatase type 2/haloperoxidase domain-containing protein n=1 Tax=Prymnesium parvum TaxID=97485 RepID=A0AB34J722_PRYPA
MGWSLRAALLHLVLLTSPSLNLRLRALFMPADRLVVALSRLVSLSVTELFMTLCVPLAASGIDRRFARHLMLLFSLVLVLVNATKNALRLPRPRAAEGASLSREEAGFGFPSLHSAASLAIPLFARSPSSYAPLAAALSHGAARWLALAWPWLVGFARLHLGVHSLPDVIGGWACGYAIAALYEAAVSEGYADALLTATWLPLLVVPVALLLAIAHPRPRVHTEAGLKKDKSVSESAIVLGCSAGTAIAIWCDAHRPHLACPPLAAVTQLEGGKGVAAKLLLALLLTGGSKVLFQAIARAVVNGVHKLMGSPETDGVVQDCCIRVFCYTGLGYVVLGLVPQLTGTQ